MSLERKIMALPQVASYSGRALEAVELRNNAAALATDGDYKGSGFIDVDPAPRIHQRKLEVR